jgi:hypothetical protein
MVDAARDNDAARDVSVREGDAHRGELRLGILALLLILGLLLFPSCRSNIRGALTSDRDHVVGGDRVGVGASAFRISGDGTQPIFPGLMVPIDLRITNPHDVTLAVTGLDVTVRRVTAPNADASRPCSAADFALVQVPSSIRVSLPALSTRALSSLDIARTAWPRVGMINRPVNQDGCKGATLTLAYTGSGTLGS